MYVLRRDIDRGEFFRSSLSLSLGNDERDRWFMGAVRFDFGRR